MFTRLKHRVIVPAVQHDDALNPSRREFPARFCRRGCDCREYQQSREPLWHSLRLLAAVTSTSPALCISRAREKRIVIVSLHLRRRRRRRQQQPRQLSRTCAPPENTTETGARVPVSFIINCHGRDKNLYFSVRKKTTTHNLVAIGF